MVKSLENIQQPANCLLITKTTLQELPDNKKSVSNRPKTITMDLQLEPILVTCSYINNKNRSTK